MAGSGQTEPLSSSNLSDWRSLVTTKALAKSVKDCGVQRITAVAGDGNDPILGVQCSQRGRIGVLFPRPPTPVEPSPGPSGGPRLSGSRAGSPPRALASRRPRRQVPGRPAGSNGLATVQSGRSSSLVAFGPRPPVRVDPVETADLPTGWAVHATATGGGSGGAITVLLDWAPDAGSSLWPAPALAGLLPPSRPSAEAVVTVGSRLEAFVVANSTLTIWPRAPVGDGVVSPTHDGAGALGLLQLMADAGDGGGIASKPS